MKGLGHGNVSPCLKHHHCNGLSGEHVTDDELSDNVETDLLIGDSLDHTDGDDIEEG